MGLERQLWEPFVRALVGESPPSSKSVMGELSGPFRWQPGKCPCRKISLFPRDVVPGCFFLGWFPLQAAIMFHSHAS